MPQPLVWLIGLEAVGLVALPLAFLLFRHLPDRGYSLAKPLGLLLVFYLLWLLGLTGFIPNTLGTVVGILVVLAAVALVVWHRHRREFALFLRREAWTILLMEVLFLAFFLGWTFIRAHISDINHTEQPMDFALLNATVRSPHFPPQDPWLAGYSVSYYYFGYLMMGGMTTLTGLSTSISYNLALATIPALAASAIFGLVYNLVRLSRGSVDAGSLTGLGAVLLLVWVGNLEGVLEFLQASGVGSTGFWTWVGIENLTAPAGIASGFYPDRFWWWFQATRIIPGGVITEFPVFSFALGDLHPHVMSIPFVLLALGLLLNRFIPGDPVEGSWLRRNKGTALTLAFVLGTLPFINMWDFPTIAVMAVVLLFVRAYGQTGGRLLQAAGRALGVALPLLLGALLLFLPFYLTFHSQAMGVLPFREEATRPFHSLLIWGLFLFLSVTFLLFQLRETPARDLWRRHALIAAGVVLIPFGLWVLVEIVVVPVGRWVIEAGNLGPVEGALVPVFAGTLSDAPGNIARQFLDILPLMVLMGTAVYGLLGRARVQVDAPTTFVLVLLALAYLLILGPELFFLVDVFGNRMNTVFKLYYQGWIFLAVACSYGLYYVQRRWPLRGVFSRAGASVWWSVLVLLVAASLYYPVAAIQARTIQEGGPRVTLDGLAHVADSQPGEYTVIQFLQAHAPREAVILEAVGGDYTNFGRISASTGLPTVIGWIGHERQWRGSSAPYEGRAQDVQEIYTTPDVQRAEALLEKYHVQYIVVGPRERQQYGTQGLEKFPQMARTVLSSGDMTLYQVTE